ncbi:MAG: cytochrome c oxidase assembly protein [Rickettsiales bacterium]|nr:cytochrome c oxidase assembly protein [Rickettsiales bacterium]
MAWFKNKNTALAANLAALVVGMLMLAYASVPLYRLFCQVTGYGGTTQTAIAAGDKIYDREITISFNADLDPELPWSFTPGEKKHVVKVGQQALTYYIAQNRASTPITGHATYNVLPFKAGLYFKKIECFCFTEQLLAAGQTVHMPISFFIDPAILDDPELKDVHTITLSYTFFSAKNASNLPK